MLVYEPDFRMIDAITLDLEITEDQQLYQEKCLTDE